MREYGKARDQEHQTVGGLLYRQSAREVEHLRVRPHVARMVRCAWDMATRSHLRDLRLRRWAHALGFRGHCFTKSRRYSTTFSRLRRARHELHLRHADGGKRRDPKGRPTSDDRWVEIRRWAFTGTGYRTLGDAWLAESARARVRDRRRVARQNLAAAGAPNAFPKRSRPFRVSFTRLMASCCDPNPRLEPVLR